MANINVNRCPYAGRHNHIMRTGYSRRFVVLCDECHDALMDRLRDKIMLTGMLKSVMSDEEVAKMRHERKNMLIEKDLADTVFAAHMVAGFTRHLMLPAQEVV